MTIFENIKIKNIDELAEWLAEHCTFDNSPWYKWYDELYCNHCESEVGRISGIDRDMEFAWCELHDKCKFFEDMDDIPDTKQIIKMWLESESNDKKQECYNCKHFVGCETACGGVVCNRYTEETES